MNYSVFQNPRKNWSNIDILYTEEGRQEVASVFPDLFRCIDWPEIRQFFDKYEQAAKRIKALSRYMGLAAVLTSASGLSILAFVPWLSHFTKPEVATLIGLVLLGAGIILGLWMRFGSAATRTWLINRFWAERARQFQFQYFIAHLSQMAAAMRSEEALELWRQDRADAFGQFAFEASRDPLGIYESVVLDDAATRDWLPSAGQRTVTLPSCDTERAKILCYFEQLRVGYQLQYARSQNLAANVYSKKGLAAAAARTVFGLIVVFTLTTLGICAYILMGPVQPSNLALLFGVQGLFAAMIAAVRVIEEGLAWRAEASRYLVYEAGLSVAEAGLRSNSTEEVVSSLLATEKLAYDELRAFLIAHREPRFII